MSLVEMETVAVKPLLTAEQNTALLLALAEQELHDTHLKGVVAYGSGAL